MGKWDEVWDRSVICLSVGEEMKLRRNMNLVIFYVFFWIG